MVKCTLPKTNIVPENSQNGPKRTFHQLQPLELSEAFAVGFWGGVIFTESFRYLPWRINGPCIFGYFGGGISLTKALHIASIGEYLHFRYLNVW